MKLRNMAVCTGLLAAVLPLSASADTVSDITALQAALIGSAPLKAGYDQNQDAAVNVIDLILMKIAQHQTDGATDPSAVLEPKHTVHTGQATYYYADYNGGTAMLGPVSSAEMWACAMNATDYNGAQLAGAYIEVTGPSGTTYVYVMDKMPSTTAGNIDLDEGAFAEIAALSAGRVDISWQIVPLPGAADAPISYQFMEGSSKSWCAIQLRNHRYPVTKLEYLGSDGEYVEIARRDYNYFVASGVGDTLTLRITDIYGQVVVDEGIPFSPGETVEGHVQLPE